MSADHALDLPALSIDALEEPPFHLPPILRLGPAATAKTPVSKAFYKVGADVVAFQAGGVNGPLGLGGDQAELAGTLENGS